MKTRINYFLGIAVSMYSIVMFAPGDIVDPENEQPEKIVSFDATRQSKRRNRWLNHTVDSRRIWQDPAQIVAEESMKRMNVKHLPIALKSQEERVRLKDKKFVNFDDSSTTFVESDEQSAAKSVASPGVFEDPQKAAQDNYLSFSPIHKATPYSDEELSKRQISEIDLDARLAKRKKMNEQAKKRRQFQQQKEENMTEEEMAKFWEASEQNSVKAYKKVQQKVAQEMKDEELKKQLKQQGPAPTGGVRRIIKENDSKPIWTT
ncbi:MAG: hypothetical protein WC747_01460 [Candidatus Babeliales bacterium]|jgi:hypothetical protein